jgi:hypothetical protein
MKHLVSILIVTLSVNGFAQNWAPFPLDSTSEWHVVTTAEALSQFCYTTTVTDYEVLDTVTQNGQQYLELAYHRVYWNSPAWPMTPPPSCSEQPMISSSGDGILVRYANGVMRRATETGEEVLYDFTLVEGDTMYWQSEPYNAHYVVDSIDQIMVGTNDCKRLWVNVFNSTSNPVWIIEGVGHQHGLFPENMMEFENTGDLCYKENDVPVVFHNRFGETGVCYVTSVNEGQNQNDISVTPNPSTGIFQLNLQQRFGYQVYDLFGKLVDEGNSSGQSTINLSSQPSGIYLLKVGAEQGSSVQKLVKQ